MEAAAEVAALVGKVAERLYAEEDDGGHEGITEASVLEVMNWLELEIKLAAGATSLPLPPATAPPLYATVCGGNESCGSSLSGPASTVMASVDGRPGAPPPPAVPWPWPFPDPGAAIKQEEYDDADDEWVLELLTDGPALEGPWGGNQ
ncbi:hypothetical protein HU200_019447 [Digitaria exilis]|uniref:Uncharacterized protein n=1 Tax=Digitaria exilis TaxID=1010633 RepID=A0A835KI40_9POAL|nr:hypothetical protein HU200_019447 [Digitaria exilis]CAB3460473.1 unnamed protein product [Digitaria exilis]